MFVLDDILIAAAIGGAMGGLSNEDDPLEGALQGAALGGLGAIGGAALGGMGAAGTEAAALTGEAAAVQAAQAQAAQAAAMQAAQAQAAQTAGLGALDSAVQGAIQYPGSGIGPSMGEYAQAPTQTMSDAVAPGPAPSNVPMDIDYVSGTTYPRVFPSAGEGIPTESSFFDKAMDWAKKNPGTALTGGILAANALGGRGGRGPAEYTPGILDTYRLSPNFQGRFANPQDFQYASRRYAEGGIASYNESNSMRNPYETGGAATYPQAAIPMSDYSSGLEEPRARNTTTDIFFNNAEGMADGGSTSALLSTYERMMRRAPSRAPAPEGGVGIYSDADPDTRNLDAYRAAQVRLAKTAKRANVAQPAMQKTAGLGSLSMGPAGVKKDEGPQFQEAAQGGIMGASHLGGYAAGGNPRLLKGPGDGMSDDIPATINGRQPARLADGEFVIPADVVSHLGNGSTDAGAEKLHHMMDKVRKARTGNPKQGKQINPDKFIPR